MGASRREMVTPDATSTSISFSSLLSATYFR